MATQTNSKYHRGAHNKHRKASEANKLAGWSTHKQAVYKKVKNKAKQCRRDSRKALADDMNMTLDQLRHQHPHKDVHHTKRMSWTLRSNGTIDLHCPIKHTKLIDQSLNRGQLRDAEIRDTKYSFEEQYNRATRNKRSKKIAKKGIDTKRTHRRTAGKITNTVLVQAIKCMSSYHKTPATRKRFLEQAHKDRNNPKAYSTLTKADLGRLKSPCYHRNRPRCPVVITTNKNRRTHIIAGLHTKHFPCTRLHILAVR